MTPAVTFVPSLLVTIHGPAQHPWACRGQNPSGRMRWGGQACKSVSSCRNKLSGEKQGTALLGRCVLLSQGQRE